MKITINLQNIQNTADTQLGIDRSLSTFSYFFNIYLK